METMWEGWHDVAGDDVGRLAHQHEKMWEDWHISGRRCGTIGISAGDDVGRLAHQREKMWEGWHISGRRCGKVGTSARNDMGNWHIAKRRELMMRERWHTSTIQQRKIQLQRTSVVSTAKTLYLARCGLWRFQHSKFNRRIRHPQA